VLIVLATAIVLGFVHKDVPTTHQMLERTSPNFFELMIALAGGAAGAYASISPRLSVAFVGVAIATALVPPLASCGLLLARGDFDLAEGAFLLAVMNIVAIQSSASFVMWASGIAPGKLRELIAPNLLSVAILLLLGEFWSSICGRWLETRCFRPASRAISGRDLRVIPGCFWLICALPALAGATRRLCRPS